MARLGLAILVGLLLAVTTPGFANEKDPEPAWMQQALELSQQWKKLRQEENELCARRAKALGGGKLHCMTHIADRDFRTGYDAPKRIARRMERDRRNRVKELLDAGVDADTRDFAGNTPLILVSGGSGDSELMAILLERGASPNVANKKGNTPLILAAWSGHWAAVEMLLKHGAHETVNARGIENMTALHWASLHGRPRIAEALLRAGADPFAKADKHHTVIDLADIGRKKTRGSTVPYYETIKALRRAQAMIAEQMKGGTKKKRKPRLRVHPL
jgi:ankyrin repeat protein